MASQRRKERHLLFLSMINFCQVHNLERPPDCGLQEVHRLLENQVRTEEPDRFLQHHQDAHVPRGPWSAHHVPHAGRQSSGQETEGWMGEAFFP